MRDMSDDTEERTCFAAHGGGGERIRDMSEDTEERTCFGAHFGEEEVRDLSDDTEERTCFVALLRDRSEMPEIEDGRLVGTGEISSVLLVLVDVGRRLMFAALCGLIGLGVEILGAAAEVGISMLKSDASSWGGGNRKPTTFGVWSEQALIASKRESFRSSFTSLLDPAASGVSIRGVRLVSELSDFDVGVSIL